MAAAGPPAGRVADPPAPPVPADDAQNRAPVPQLAPPLLRPPAMPRRLPRFRKPVDQDSPERPPLSVDRQILKEMEAAAESLGKKQFPEALHHLQHVLESPEDSWIEIPGSQGPTFQSAKRQAADRIGQLPASARESYETEYGQIARQQLDEATRRGDTAELAEVVGRYFHTRAGYKAAYALANRLFDASMPLPAAAQFELLRKSPGGAAFEPMLSLKEAFSWLRIGAVDKCNAILAEMKRGPSGKTITIGGQKTTIPEGTEARQWLAKLLGSPSDATRMPPPRDWLLAGGAPDRNALSGDALPLGEPVWTQSLIRDRDFPGKDRFDEIEAALEEHQRELIESEGLTIPSGAPLVIGKTAVFRSFARLRAVDLHTGEPLWDFAERDRLYQILGAARRQTRRGNRLPISMDSNPQDELQLFFNARTFRDMTYANLSSDGERVFAVSDGGFLGLSDPQTAESNDGFTARHHNLLCGVDVASGRLLWELGGTRSDRNRDLAGTFFLGCGLPIGSALYVLGELDGEISLYKIDSATGRRLYSQRVASPLGRLPIYPLRRLAGGSPSSAGGLLICPITGGVVTAFDPAARTLAWEYTYTSTRTGGPENWTDEPNDTQDDGKTRWLDSTLLVDDGAVLLTPRDSNELHCLNLADGSLRWKQPRENRLFLAGAADGVLYIVGRTKIEALRLKDGTDAWGRSLELGTPAGRGYRNGSLYHLPLATGDLATIDLHRARIITRTRFEKGVHPGNLVSAEGVVLMESAATLQGFRPTADVERSVAEALEKKPDDAAALATRGELRLDRGQTDKGLEDLTRSEHLRPDARVQSIAVATALESLRFDFAGSRALAERLGPQITDPGQRVEFHRLMAAGLTQTGDLDGALNHELSLLADQDLNKSLVNVGESLKVQVQQLVAPQLAELFAKADADKRAHLSKKIDDWATHLAAEGQVEQLRRAVAALGKVPMGIDLRRALVAKLAKDDQAELVRQLTWLRASSDPKAAGTASARLARLLIDHHRPELAVDLLAELGDRFKTVDCADGKTGAQLAAAWGSEAPVKAARVRSDSWPGSEWTAKDVSDPGPIPDPATPVAVEQRSGPFYRHWRFEARRPTERGFTLVAIDPTGNERWQLEIKSRDLDHANWGEIPLALRIHGPLIEVALRRGIVMLDGFDGAAPPRILWWRGLSDPLWSAANQMRSEVSLVGLLAGERAFYQIGATLSAADIVTGRPIWERHNISFPYSLEGDGDYVIAVSRTEPMDPKGLVLQAASGKEVFYDQFKVQGPLAGEWHGRRILTTGYSQQLLTCALFDLVAQKAEWSQTYPLPAWPLSIDEEEFAVLDSELKLHFHSATTGEQLFETTFSEGLNSPQLAVRRIGDRYVVLRQSGGFRSMPGYLGRPTSDRRGVWVIDRHTGKIAWSGAAQSPQLLVDLPAQSPVLVLLRPLSRFEAGRTGTVATMISILDAKTGKPVYEGRESVTADRINVRLDPDAHKVIVTTDTHRLEVAAKNAG